MSPQRTLFLRWLTLAFVTAVFLSPFTPLQARSPGEQKGAQSKPSPRAQLLPLDPLTAEERKLAEQLAREDGRVRELLGAGRSRLISVELLFLKPEHEETAAPTKPVPIDRHAEVLFRRLEDESGVRAVVNLTKRSVAAAARITSAEVPLTPEDIAEAAKFALEDAQLKKELGEDVAGYSAAATSPGTRNERFAITGLRLFSSAEDDPCTKHRCVRLMFRRGQDYLGQPVVWVDLTERHVYVERREQ
jgi:Cu2+-containing amine oxidase